MGRSSSSSSNMKRFSRRSQSAVELKMAAVSGGLRSLARTLSHPNENTSEDDVHYARQLDETSIQVSDENEDIPDDSSDKDSTTEDEIAEPQPTEDLKKLKFHDVKSFLMGMLVIGGIAVSSALLNYYAKNTSTTYFHGPLFLIWFRSNWRITAFPIFMFFRKIYEVLFCRCKGAQRIPIKHLITNGTKIYGARQITAKIFFIDIVFLSSLTIAVQYLTFAPYHFVSAGNGTAIAASNVAWAYILSAMILGVDVMPVKILGVASSFVGVVLLAYHEGFNNPDWESAVMLAAGAFANALYAVLYKKRIAATTDLGQISFTVSTMAFFTMFTMWPIVMALYLTKSERWEWHSIPWDIICKNSAASYAFNFLVNLGIAWTNPVFVGIGWLLAAPLAHFFDATLREKQFAPAETGGTVMICVGFLVIVLADRVSITGIKNAIVSAWGVITGKPKEGSENESSAPTETSAETTEKVEEPPCPHDITLATIMRRGSGYLHRGYTNPIEIISSDRG